MPRSEVSQFNQILAQVQQSNIKESVQKSKSMITLTELRESMYKSKAEELKRDSKLN